MKHYPTVEKFCQLLINLPGKLVTLISLYLSALPSLLLVLFIFFCCEDDSEDDADVTVHGEMNT